MSVSIAHLNGRVFDDLELAGEFCNIEDVHSAVVQKLNLRMSQSRYASTNVTLSRSTVFSPTTLEYSVSSLIQKGTPEWVEVKGTDSADWRRLRVVPLSELSAYADNGIFACSFWSQEDPSTDTVGMLLSFSMDPSGSDFRIYYAADSLYESQELLITIPDHVADLIVLEAENVLIQKRIIPKLALDARRDEAGRELTGILIKALEGIYQQNLMDIPELTQLWKVWAFREAAPQGRPSKAVTPTGRFLYG